MLLLAGLTPFTHSALVPPDSAPPNRLKQSLQGLKRAQGYRWHQFKMRHVHWTVTSKSMGGGFVANGNWRAVTHFSRNFLGSPSDLVIKSGWHGRLNFETLRDQAARYGLVASAEAVFPPELRPCAVSWPRLVGIEADLTGGLEGCRRGLNSSALGDMRRLRREGFFMKVQAARPIFDEFYQRYYLPSMRNRHGADAYLHELESERTNLGPNDVFVEVHAAEGCLAKVIVTEEEDGIRLSRLGWLGGSEDIYRKSVLGALYWFSLTYATEQGYPKLNFGSVTPYLEDGLFTYKEKWLGRLSWRKSFHDEWRVLADPTHVTTRRFFDRNSLLIKNETTRRFDVISNRNREDVASARVESAHLGEWLSPHQVWRSRSN